jgi:hypothetical protein
MTTFPINEAKIKMAWREKYLTDGANEQALAHPRGAYRGFWPIPRPAPDDHIRIAIDPFALGVDVDSFAIYADRTNGFSVSIRETTDVDLDCAALFPVVGATEDWWVSIDAAYTPNVTTTANYRVDKVDPRILNPDAIVLGVLPMASGDVTIHTAGVYADRSIPSPTARQHVADYVPGDEPWGLFDGLSKWCLGTGAQARSFAEPSIDSFALVGATTFHLSGEFYVGRDGLNTAAKYFRLMDSTTAFNSPLLGSDGGRIVPSVVVYLSDGITPINPGVDADAEGFYANPWLAFSFADTVDANVTGTVRVLGYKKKTLLTLDNAPAGAFPLGDMEQGAHARWVLAKAAAGVPESLAAGLLSSQLVSLLGHINDRIETIHPTGAPGDWVLLWRSHGITLDANVTKQTSSLYFGDKGLALVHGGYIKIADGDVYAANIGAGGDDVSIMYLRSGGSGGLTFGVKSGPVAASHWDIETGWTFYTDYSSSTGEIQTAGAPLAPGGGIRWYQGVVPDMFNSIFATTVYSLQDETEDVGVGLPRTRRYFRQGGVRYAVNCHLDETAPGVWEWIADDDSYPAIVLQVEKDGVEIHKKHEDEIVGVTPWADSAWTTEWKIGQPAGDDQASYSCMNVEGFTFEGVRFGWQGMVTAATATLQVSDVCNYRVRLATAPVAGDFTLGVYTDSLVKGTSDVGFETFVAGPMSAFIFNIDNWGFRIATAGAPEMGCDPTQWYYFEGLVYIEVS